MDVKEHLLARKRQFDEQVRQYKGPDPLKLRCDFIKALEGYDKDLILEIYTSVLEDTLRAFIEEPHYKQDLRFIQLWLRYSNTQPNPAEVYENMYRRGLGTECAVFYSSWAEQLFKNGLFVNADKIFKMGLTSDVKTKCDLQKSYDEFLKIVGYKLLFGEIVCSSCGGQFSVSKGNAEKNSKTETSGDVEVWEWNPLKVGEEDDFTCPLAYFEEPDQTKKRMYPKDKVYPGNGQEFSLEELLAVKYERIEEDEKQKKLAAEMKSIEDEARRQRDELRKIEAEKIKLNTITELNPPVQASIPVITPKMLNLPKDMDNSLANGSTFTVHTKEALKEVQDMWSSPQPADTRPRHIFQTNSPQESEIVPPKSQAQFKIFSDDEKKTVTRQSLFPIFDDNSENNVPSNKQPLKAKIPFDIYNENEPPTKLAAPQSVKQGFALKPKVPFEIYDENIHSRKTPLSHKNNENQNDQNMVGNTNDMSHDRNGRLRCKLFSDDGSDELAKKMEAQAKLNSMFPLQVKNDDFEDVTCNTKAFEFVLPSSTPFANHKKPAMSIPKTNSEENLSKKIQGNTNLSDILEQSKERYSTSSTNSSTSQTPKIPPKSVPVISTVSENFDPFSGEVLEDLLSKIGFPKQQYANNLFFKYTNVPNFSKTLKLGDDSYSIQGEIGKGAYARVMKASKGNSIVALKVEKPPCKWEFYIAKEIQSRIPPKLTLLFMDILEAHIYNNGSVLVTQWAKHGTLLGIVNTFKEKTGRSLEPGVVFHFGIELIDIVDYLHRSNLIHADMKPDNIVIRELPEYKEAEPCIQLIDFGRCIDMNLLPPGTQFNCVFKTEDNKCNEMKDSKPWSFQIDLYGLANTFHCLLLAEYMKVMKKNDKWMLQKQIPRNMRREVWNPIFETLLNVNPATDLPMNFTSMRASLIEAFDSSLNPSMQSLITFKNYITSK